MAAKRDKKRNDVAAHLRTDIIVRRIEAEDKHTGEPLIDARNVSMEDLITDISKVFEKYGGRLIP